MRERPTGITVLSVLGIIGGIALCLQGLNAVNQSMLFIIYTFFLGILALSSGIGMVIGKKWGWWLGAFYYVYAILRYVNTIISTFILSNQPQYASEDILPYLAKYGIRIVIHALILLYFYKSHVTEYFNVSQYSKTKSILVLFGIGIAIMVCSTLLVTLL